MAKVIKEITLALLLCLVIILLFAVVFYKFLPNRKVVPTVVTYTASEEIKELLNDKIDDDTDQVVLTYEVTSRELDNYEVSNEYIPGKANPFATTVENVDDSDDEENNGNDNNSSKNENNDNEDDDSIIGIK